MEVASAGDDAGRVSSGGDDVSAFERLLWDVPAILHALPAEDRREVAATSWTALRAALEHTSLDLTIFFDKKWAAGKGGMLHSIARRIERQDTPVAGNIRLCGPCTALLPADDARTVEAAFEVLRAQDTSRFPEGIPRLEMLVRVAANLKRPLRVRGVEESPATSMVGHPGPASLAEQRLVALLQRDELRDHLIEFCWRDCKFSPSTIRALPAAAKLERVKLVECAIGDGDGAAALGEAVRSLPRLRALTVAFAGLRDGGVSQLVEALADTETLEYLDLNSNDIRAGGVDVARMLARNSSVRVLSMCDNPLRESSDDDSFASASSSSSRPATSGCGAALGDALAANTTLEELYLCENAMEEDDGLALARGLAKNATLRTLSVGESSLTSVEGAGDGFLGALADAIEHGVSAIERLHLFEEPFLLFLLPGVGRLARALARRSTLVELDLSNTAVEGEDMVALADAIRCGALGETLEVLLVKGVVTESEGFEALAGALDGNTVLRELRMCGTPLGGEVAGALGAALAHNDTLHTLDLSFCDIGGEGAEGLARGLRNNVTLRFLDVHGNNIDWNGHRALMDLAGRLEVLNLEHQ